ncbi:hypothetical protein [Hyphomonas sp.]|uniref:hypothetical protein n=1 Tax=Hyphomonas sp. TaxID=87 RepID=UPI000DFDD515|nr:hypothetical protein [Hyphomonas sp.]RCL88523.1 MAG: hypothetical protein DBW63_04235 [Hyphomonas sp.]
MTEFGPNGEVVGTGPSDLSVDYRALSKDRKIRRVKLGLLLSSLAACLGVTLIGLFLTFVFGVLEGIGMLPTMFDRPNSGFLFGIQMAAMMSLFNFILFFVTVPAAWLAMGLSIGRFPHQGIAARAPYLRWASIWGALLVGGTTGGFGVTASLLTGLGAALTGACIGALAGLVCGLLFLTIVKPAQQLHEADISVF